MATQQEREIEKAKSILSEAGYIMHLWHKDNIKDKAESMDVELTEKQLNSIANRLECIDYEYGINWQTIEDLVEMEEQKAKMK